MYFMLHLNISGLDFVSMKSELCLMYSCDQYFYLYNVSGERYVLKKKEEKMF